MWSAWLGKDQCDERGVGDAKVLAYVMAFAAIGLILTTLCFSSTVG